MSDVRDTNYNGKVSFADKVKGMFHHHHQGTTTSGSLAGGIPTTGVMPVAGVIPTTGVMPAAGIMPATGVIPTAGIMPQYGAVCQDPNCPDNAINCNDPNCSHISGGSGFGGRSFHDSRDLNRGGRLGSGATGLDASNVHDSLDQNPNVHIDKGERLESEASGFGGSNFRDSRDLNRDGHISTGERLASFDQNPNIHIKKGDQLASGASGFGGSNFNDSRDLNRDGYISTGERLASGTSGFGGSNFQDSRHLNRDATGERLASGASGFGGSNFNDSRDLNRAGFDDASRLKLHEEQLAVSKREVGAGAVDIHKRVKEEHVQQTVPLKHQELAIERRALHGLAEPGAQISSQDEMIHVPLYREELVTEKRVVPTEEVIVRKNELTENQTVGATLRSEYVEPRQTFDDGHVREKFQGLSMNKTSDPRDVNHDGHVSMGEKLKGATGTNTTQAARG